MRILRIELRDWGRHANLCVDFSRDSCLTGIVGPNGSGKSTLVEAIFTLLTGVYRQLRGEMAAFARDLPGKVKASSFSGLLEFEHAGVCGEIRRTVSVSKSKTGGWSASQKAALRLNNEATPITGATEVKRRMHQLVGDDIDLLGEFSFIAQSELTRIVSRDMSTRTESLHKLFGLARFEQIWDMLGKEISTVPAIKATDDPKLLEQDLEALRNDIADNQKRVQDFTAQIEAPDLAAAQKDIDAYERLGELRPQMERASALVTTIKNALQVEQNALTEGSLKLHDLSVDADAKATFADTARVVLEQLAAAKTAQAAIDRATQRKTEKQQALAALVQPTAPVQTFTADDQLELQRLDAEINTSNSVIQRYRNLSSTKAADCPTCGQPVTDIVAHVLKHETTVANNLLLRGPLAKKLTDFNNATALFTRQQAEYTSRQQSFTESIAECDREILDNQPKVAALFVTTAEDVKLCQESITESTAAANALLVQRTLVSDLQTRVKLKQAEVQRAEADEKTVRAELESLSADKARLTPEHVDACRRAVATVSMLTIERAKCEGRIEELNTRVGQVTLRLASAKHTAEVAQRCDFVRNVLTDARNILHRDRLPSQLAQRFLLAINTELAVFLRRLQSPFTATVDLTDGYNFRCIFPDGSERDAGLLSGGEKAMFCVAFLLAVHEALASRFGVLVFDEPTENIDDENTQLLIDALGRVRTFAQESGMQVFVVTHAAQILASFDELIQLKKDA